MTTPVEDRRDTARDATLVALAALTVRQLGEAWTVLGAAQQDVIQAVRESEPGSRSGRVKTALAALVAATAGFDRTCAGLVTRWVSIDLPIAYRDGAVQALRRAGADADRFAWTVSHQATLTALTAVAYADLMRRVQEAVRRAQALGRDAVAGAADPEVLAGTYPPGVVVYGNQARHPVVAWARSALVAQATWAANTGSLRAAMDELGCEWMEIADGPACGWVAHQDTDHAAGTIRSVDECAAYPIAHPGCIRELIPRPDLTGRDGIENGQAA